MEVADSETEVETGSAADSKAANTDTAAEEVSAETEAVTKKAAA